MAIRAPQLPSRPKADQYSIETLTSPIVTLRVGPDGTTFTAHKSILGRFEEGMKNHINFPDESPEDMVPVLRFLHTGNVLSAIGPDLETLLMCWPEESKLEETRNLRCSLAGTDLDKMIGLYVVADRYCIQGMCDRVLDLAEKCVDLSGVEWRHLNAVKAAGLMGSKMWQMLTHRSAHECASNGDKLKKIMDDGLKVDPEAAVDLLDELANMIPHPWTCEQCLEAERERSGWSEKGWSGRLAYQDRIDVQ
ncbi:hypothetical protein H2200_004953 [Cladophialophora chaetospira]|uniref:BTB domain-containing protein n=1 Tax=Cladophialophora chaetospira TaxID=386627 RepID=A0AA38XEA1_9EURO|nr:hypothetical protein H2200_004953 [Cladophialophora chaetospira]